MSLGPFPQRVQRDVRFDAGRFVGGSAGLWRWAASFTAEASAAGIRAAAVDPLYAFSGPEIRARFEATVELVLSQVRTTPDDWTWSFHRDPDDLLANRRAAIEKFLADYEDGLRGRRYVFELPPLPFASGEFGLGVCSHLLFLYSDLLSERFHVQSVLELCRVARAVRFFPLLTLRRWPSPHLAGVQAALRANGCTSEVVRVEYELQRGGPDCSKPQLVCTRSTEVVEIEECIARELEARIALSNGFKAVTHRLEFFGVCPACQQPRLKLLPQLHPAILEGAGTP